MAFVLVGFVIAGDPFRVDENIEMGENDIYNATNVNATNLYQNGSRVLDTDDINGTTYNHSTYSDYWDDLDTEANLTPSNFLTAGDYISYTGDTLNVADNWWNADADISADEISESKIGFSTVCGAGNHLYISGNDLACEADDDTTYTAGGTLLDLTTGTFSVNEGTLTDTKYCTYESGTGIECTSEDTNTQLTQEQVQDYAGAMAGSHLTYTDGSNDLSVDDDWWNAYSDFMGTTTTDKWCLWDGSEIDCNVEPVSDTNESTRVNTMVGTDCAAGNYSYGFDTDGNIQCRPDTSGSGGSQWTLTGDYLYNNSGDLDLNETKLNSTINALDSDTTYTAGGTLLDLTGETFSVNEGTLTDDNFCNYEATGTQIECTNTANDILANSANIASDGTIEWEDAADLDSTGAVNGQINANQVDNFDIAGPNSYYYANIINMSDESVTYVDGSSLFLPLDGSSVMTGNLDMNTYNIYNVTNITGTYNLTYTKITATTSANWASKITDESGTGVFAFTISPTFTTPNLGTATASTLNTGHGNNELYHMNQDVLTNSDVTFSTITTTNMTIQDNVTYAKSDGIIRSFSNSCYEKVNATGVYWIC